MAALVLAACQSAPVGPTGKTTTAGDWSVTTGGSVSIEGGYVH